MDEDATQLMLKLLCCHVDVVTSGQFVPVILMHKRERRGQHKITGAYRAVFSFSVQTVSIDRF